MGNSYMPILLVPQDNTDYVLIQDESKYRTEKQPKIHSFAFVSFRY